MPFGKYKGLPLEAVPEDYLLWVLDNCDRINPFLRQAISRRLGLDEPRAGPRGTGHSAAAVLGAVDGAIARWYSEMARRYHPDRGGTNQQMQAINEAYGRLRELLRELPAAR